MWTLMHSGVVMARYGRGGKRWIRYDTAQNIAIRYDTIWYNTVPKRCAVCQQSKINVAFSLTPSHAFASCFTTPSAVVDDIRPLSIISGRVWTWGRYDIKNLALIDFSSVQTDAVNCGRSHTIERRSRRANVSTCSVLLDFSSVLTDV